MKKTKKTTTHRTTKISQNKGSWKYQLRFPCVGMISYCFFVLEGWYISNFPCPSSSFHWLLQHCHSNQCPNVRAKSAPSHTAWEQQVTVFSGKWCLNASSSFWELLMNVWSKGNESIWLKKMFWRLQGFVPSEVSQQLLKRTKLFYEWFVSSTWSLQSMAYRINLMLG